MCYGVGFSHRSCSDRLLASQPSEQEIAEHLVEIERTKWGLNQPNDNTDD